MNISLIFAGGVGSRMGSEVPKQFLVWNNKTILIHTLERFDKHPEIDEIIIACKSEWKEYARKLINESGIRKVVSIVDGGETALDSQYNGLVEIEKLHPNEKITVLIHDGVRPLVDFDTISKNINSVKKYGNAITVTKAIETVITVSDDEGVTGIIDRNQCRMARAPQSFYLDEILGVHRKAIRDQKHNYIDSASMMIDYGYTLHTVEGKPENIKITTPSDYYMFLGICAEKDNEKK